MTEVVVKPKILFRNCGLNLPIFISISSQVLERHPKRIFLNNTPRSSHVDPQFFHKQSYKLKRTCLIITNFISSGSVSSRIPLTNRRRSLEQRNGFRQAVKNGKSYGKKYESEDLPVLIIPVITCEIGVLRVVILHRACHWSGGIEHTSPKINRSHP